MSKDIDIVCVACGSRNIVVNSEGGWTCLDCGFKWTEEIYEQEESQDRDFNDEKPPYDEDESGYGYPDESGEEDAYSEEEEFWFK